MSGVEPAKPSHAQEIFSETAPVLGDLIDGLFGEVWERPQLSTRERHLITLASLITSGATGALPAYFRRAQEGGVRKAEMGEILGHLAYYAGLPRATEAFKAIRDVLEDQG